MKVKEEKKRENVLLYWYIGDDTCAIALGGLMMMYLQERSGCSWWLALVSEWHSLTICTSTGALFVCFLILLLILDGVLD